MELKLSVRSLQNKLKVDPRILKRIALKTLCRGGKKSAEISVILLGDKAIKELNLSYHGDPGPTDVLSFDSSENKKEMKLDIAISADTAVKNASFFGTSPLYEVYLYTAHGILHALGYDDNTAKKRLVMQKKAENILKTLNFQPLKPICQSIERKQLF